MEQNGFISEFLAELTLIKALAGFFLGALMTALFRALLWAFGKSPQREFAFWAVTFIGIVCVLILSQAVFSPTIVLESPQSSPQLSAKIDALGWLEGDDSNSTKVILIVSIRNTGEPSIAEGWKLIVNMPEIGDREARTLYINPESTFTFPPGIKISGKDALYDKAIQPIVTNGLVRGVLQFQLDGIVPLAFSAPGSVLNLSYQDVEGRTYSAQYRHTGERGPMGYLPGLEVIQEPQSVTK